MSKSIPTIQKFMTYQPYFIQESEPISEANNIMRKSEIHHLPVMKDGNVIGIISDRDLKMVMGLLGVDPGKMLVKDVCHKDPYVVTPEASLDEVVSEMADNHYGCTVVTQNDKLVGIFTTMDCCQALSSILRQRYH